MPESTICRRWKQRIESGVFTVSLCRQWAHAVVPLSESLEPGGFRTNLKDHEARELRELIVARPEGGVLLNDEDTDRGLRWLQRYGVKRIEFPEQLLNDFDHFTFEGHARTMYSANRVAGSWPKYVFHTTDGIEAEYYATPWQAQRFYPFADPGNTYVRSMRR